MKATQTSKGFWCDVQWVFSVDNKSDKWSYSLQSEPGAKEGDEGPSFLACCFKLTHQDYS